MVGFAVGSFSNRDSALRFSPLLVSISAKLSPRLSRSAFRSAIAARASCRIASHAFFRLRPSARIAALAASTSFLASASRFRSSAVNSRRTRSCVGFFFMVWPRAFERERVSGTATPAIQLRCFNEAAIFRSRKGALTSHALCELHIFNEGCCHQLPFRYIVTSATEVVNAL